MRKLLIVCAAFSMMLFVCEVAFCTVDALTGMDDQGVMPVGFAEGSDEAAPTPMGEEADTTDDTEEVVLPPEAYEELDSDGDGTPDVDECDPPEVELPPEAYEELDTDLDSTPDIDDPDPLDPDIF